MKECTKSKKVYVKTNIITGEKINALKIVEPKKDNKENKCKYFKKNWFLFPLGNKRYIEKNKNNLKCINCIYFQEWTIHGGW